MPDVLIANANIDPADPNFVAKRSTTEPDHNHATASIIRSVKNTLTLVGGLGIVCYALGYVTVSSNLQSWGIYELPLLSSRYISVGVCLLLFLAMAVVPPYYFFIQLFGDFANPGRRSSRSSRP
jgi:hypothetical protein